VPRLYTDFSVALGLANDVYEAIDGRIAFEEAHFYIESDPHTFWARASRPRKDTLLHQLIREVCYLALDESAEIASEDPQYLVKLLTSGGVAIPHWLGVDGVDERYLDEVDPLIYQAVDVVADVVFQLLFADLAFLAGFHEVLADMVDSYDRGGWERLFTTHGNLKRPKHIPAWLRRAVFHRDRGRCRHCDKDLTGLVSVDADIHLDHLRPLAASGPNDATNFQLLCGDCNHAKGVTIEDGPWWSETYW
jgi:hypothetical protein